MLLAMDSLQELELGAQIAQGGIDYKVSPAIMLTNWG